MSVRRALEILWVVGLTFVLAAPPAWASLETLSPSIQVGGKKLALNGAAVHKWWFWDLYQVALYLEAPSTDARSVLASDQARRLHVTLLRDISRDRLCAALEKGFWANAQRTPEMEASLRRLLAAIPDGRDGEDLLITYVPGVGTRIDGPRGASVEIPGKPFANAMFSLWLGDAKNMAKIRRALLAGSSRIG